MGNKFVLINDLRGSGTENVFCACGGNDAQGEGEQASEASNRSEPPRHALDCVKDCDSSDREEGGHYGGEGLQDPEGLLVPVADGVVEKVVGFLFLKRQRLTFINQGASEGWIVRYVDMSPQQFVVPFYQLGGKPRDEAVLWQLWG